jgi:putative hemolysin
MPVSVSRIPLPLAPILPPALRPWTRQLEPALYRLLVPAEVSTGLDRARSSGAGAHFARRFLQLLDIRFAVDDGDLARFPSTGPAVVVANHPYGIVEGLILMALLDGVRPDYKLVANSLLAGVSEVRGQTILVNPFDAPEASAQNRAPLRECMEWLSAGSLLVVFPAGEVAHLDWRERAVTDGPWKPAAARLALRAACPVVPVFFDGGNSVSFQVAGAMHPGLRTIGLAREFHKLRGKTVRLRVGNPIPHASLAGSGSPELATAYLRSRTFLLANRCASARLPSVKCAERTRACPVAPPAEERLLSEEVAALPGDCELTGNDEFAVYLAPARAIPRLLGEIGRARELAFRAAGEGSGKRADLDRFDAYYQHLVLWSKADRRLAGAYRLAITTDVLPRFGTGGLYTGTLFRFKPGFFERIGPAVELGRSFVVADYQKNYSALLLLWKGITRVVQRRPEAPVLFGAVSISRDYRAASRGLMVSYLADRESHRLAQLVQPRRRFRDPMLRNPQIKRLAALFTGIEDLSTSIADIEDDGKGVPVLIRQYLKAGGKLLGFNVDPDFSDTLDALIVADLRTASQAMLERCMGRAEARAFREFHRAG